MIKNSDSTLNNSAMHNLEIPPNKTKTQMKIKLMKTLLDNLK
jgi:hypothetical protein